MKGKLMKHTRILTAKGLLTLLCLNIMAAENGKKAEPPLPLSVELGAPFRDNAILQCGIKVPIWGWSKPGVKISVTFQKQKKTAVANKDGKWTVELDPLKASFEPSELTVVEENGKSITLKNILIGEVWVASGQSNMEEPVKNTNVGKVLLKGILKRVADGMEKRPVIREARVYGTRKDLAFRGFQPSPYPVERAAALWSDGSNFSEYSSIAFAFAYKLSRELKVPVGILNCSVGATSLESWIPHEALISAETEYAGELRKRVQSIYPGTPEQKGAWSAYYEAMERWIEISRKHLSEGIPPDEPPSPPGDLGENRNGIGWMYNGMMRPFVPYAVRGIIWNQGYNNRYDGLRYYDGLMCMIPGWRKAWGRPELPVYLHQWFAGSRGSDELSADSMTEMRLSTWLAARDLPHTRMASLTDITGALHYRAKTVPGRRFARLALKYQYGKDIVAEGPTFKSYRIEGQKLIVSFDHAEGDLVVAKPDMKTGITVPRIIEDGDNQVTLFHIADENRVWHRARMQIEGNTVVVNSPEVDKPEGVAYGELPGNLPGLYNRSLLPTTPFISLGNKLFTTRSFPREPLKIAGRELPVKRHPLQEKYSKLSLLSSQFRNGVVIQADQDTTFWGEAPAGSVVHLSFADIEKTVEVPKGSGEWSITVPAMPASAEPLNLQVRCKMGDVVVHEKNITDIVVGDVWFVATSPFAGTEKGRRKGKNLKETSEAYPGVRLFTPFTRKRTNASPKRYRLEASGRAGGKFYSRWSIDGEMPRRGPHITFAYELGAKIHAKTGNPVGIVLMDTKRMDVPLKSWIGGPWLKQAPSLLPDYEALKYVYPIGEEYFSACEESVTKWKRYWQAFDATVPGKVLALKKLEPGQDPFDFPLLSKYPGSETGAASHYNMLICTFGPGNFRGILSLTPRSFFKEKKKAVFASELSAMANSWKETFSSKKDPVFLYTLPSTVSMKDTGLPAEIKGRTRAIPVENCLIGDKEQVETQLKTVISAVVEAAYSSSAIQPID